MRAFIGGVLLAALALPAPAAAAASGFLLGLREPSRTEGRAFVPDRYRTLFIAPVEGVVRLVAEGPGILSPRDPHDFWRVDVTTVRGRCGTAVRLRAQWIQGPVDAKGPARVRPEQGAREVPGRPCRGGLLIHDQILHVSPYLVSWTSGGAARREYVPLGVDSLHLHSRLDEPHGYVTAMGSVGHRLYVDAARREAAAKGLRGPEETGRTDLAIVRRPGRWVMRGRVGTAARYHDFDAPVEVPRYDALHDTLAPPWEVVRERVPTAGDAFSSPANDLLVVLVPGELRAFPVEDGAIGDEVLRVPLRPGESAVMARWATGEELARWTVAVPQLLEGGPR